MRGLRVGFGYMVMLYRVTVVASLQAARNSNSKASMPSQNDYDFNS